LQTYKEILFSFVGGGSTSLRYIAAKAGKGLVRRLDEIDDFQWLK